MRVVVSHPEQQHSYRLATALKKAGMLEKYVTTVYKKKGNMTDIVSHLLPKKYRKKAESRHCDALRDDEVIQYCEGGGLLKLLSSYVPFLRRYYVKTRFMTADRFAHKVADYAIKNDVDAVVIYDNCSHVLFQELKERAPNIIRILDMSAANLAYIKHIYEKDFKLAPAFENLLRKERPYIWDEHYMERYMMDIENAQYFLTPSEFVERSLAFSGIKQHQMLYCPYGVDLTMFHPKERYKPLRQKTIEFIYVGGVKELKGISYLLECFDSISIQDAHLTVVGIANATDLIDKYKPKVTFTGIVQHDEIIDYLLKADVFVFPSLGEGMSLTVMEAAASGLPLIVSENSGYTDKIKDGEEGWIINCQSTEQIKKAVQWFINHPEKIETMGRKANLMARKFTWERYDRNIKEIFDNLSNKLN